MHTFLSVQVSEVPSPVVPWTARGALNQNIVVLGLFVYHVSYKIRICLLTQDRFHALLLQVLGIWVDGIVIHRLLTTRRREGKGAIKVPFH